MRSMLRLISLVLLCSALLAACGSPPKPPPVDESLKRPVNSASAIDMQICQSELHNSRIAANESAQLAAATTAALEWATTSQHAMADTLAALSANQIFALQVVRGSGVGSRRSGEFASKYAGARAGAQVVVPANRAAALLDAARASPRVLLWMPADGGAVSIAMLYAQRVQMAAVRDYLVGAGVAAANIQLAQHLTPEPPVVQLKSTAVAGSAQVNVEVYRALPIVGGASTTAVQ
jgi:hypothetical protein